jgi:DNA repair protein RadA/Sms
VGGLRVSEPSADLAVAMSVLSSALEEPIWPMTAFIGEIGNTCSKIFS